MKRLPALILLLLPVLAGAEPTVVGHYPLSGLVGAAGARKTVADEINATVWIYGSQSRNLLVVDATAKKPIKSFSDFNYIYDFALDPVRSRVYVSHYTSGYKITVIDAKTFATLSEHSLAFGLYPRALAVDSGANRLYWISHKWDSPIKRYHVNLTRWNPDTGKIEATSEFELAPTYVSHWKMILSSKKAYVHRMRVTPAGTQTTGKTSSTTYDYKNEILVFNKSSLAVEQSKLMEPRAFQAPLVLDEVGGRLYSATGNRAYTFPVVSSGLLATPSTYYCRCYGDIGVAPKRNRLYAADYNAVNVYEANTGKYLYREMFKGSTMKTVAVNNTREEVYSVDYNRSDILVADAAQDEIFSTIDIRRDTPIDLSLREGTDELYIAAGQSAGISIWDTKLFKENKFLRSWSFTRGLALYPKLDKAFVFDGPSGVNGNFYTYRALNLNTRWWTYMAQSTSGLYGKAEESPTDQLLLVKQYGALALNSYKSHLLFFDPKTGLETDFAEISASTDYPRGVATNPASNRAYVALYGADAVAVVDLTEKRTVKKISVGKYPEGVAADPIWNRVFVSNYGSDSVSVIDAETDSVIATVPVGKSPRHIAIKKKGTRVYVANEGDDTISVIHGGSLKVLATLAVQGTPRDIEVDEERERVYVANYSSASITVFDDPASGDTQPPVITHTPITGTTPDYESLTVDAVVTDDEEVAVVTLTYWSVGSANYTTIPMEKQTGSLYRATIPSSELMKLKGSKVSYFIDATDFEGNGPPTGSNPGTADAPHTFTITRTLEVMWSQAFDKVYGGLYRMIPGPSASIGELRADRPGLEIATGNEEYYPLGYAGPPGRWFLFESNGTVVLTKNTENDEAHSSTNLYDLDGDGTAEILGGTTSGNQIQAFDSYGNWAWRYTLGSHAVSTPAVDVLKAGEGPTVFAGSFDKYVRAIDGKTGKLKWAFPVSNLIWSSPAVKDLDGDGKKEVLVTSESGSVYVNGVWTFSAGYLYCLDAETGSLKWKRQLPNYRKARTSPALADIDEDGIVEVLLGDGNGIFHAFAGDTGLTEWSFKTGGEIYSSAAVGDIDGDGNFEIVFGSNDGHLYALAKDGTLFWKRHLGSEVYASPALARRTPGSVLSVYATTWGGQLYVVDGKTGAIVGGASVEAEIVSSPVVGDTDGDGKLDIFFQDRKGNIGWKMKGDMFWAFRDNGSSVEAFAREWPMYRRDAAHTGVYPMQKATDEAPPTYADFRSLDENEKKIVETAYNTLASGVTVQLTVQDLESGLSQSGYSVQYSTDAGSSWRTVSASLSGNTLSGFGVNLAWTTNSVVCAGKAPCAATNQVKFSVKDIAGNQRDAGPFAIRIEEPEAPAVAPAIPTGLAVDAPHMGGSLKVTWSANGEADFDLYRLYRDNVFLIATSSTSYSDEGLTDGTTYTYRLSAVSTAELESAQSAPVSGVPADQLPPDSFILAPTDESVLGESLATISGSASDAGISGVAKVDIWLKDVTDDEDQWLVAEGTANFQVSISDLKDGHSYQAASRATDAEGNVEAQLTIVSFSLDLPPGKANTPNASAHPAGARIDLSWIGNTEGDIAAYRVYRDGKFLVQTTTVSLIDTGLTDGTTYTYRIAAIDNAGQEGPKSDAVSAIPLDGLLPSSKIISPTSNAVFSTTKVTVSGTATDTGSGGLAVVRVFVKTNGAAVEHAVEGKESFTLSLMGLTDFTTYYIVSQAEDTAGNLESTTTWTSFSIDLAPGAVVDLKATVLESQEEAALTWKASTESDLAGYRVYSDAETFVFVTKNEYSAKELARGSEFVYFVSAVDARGQEGPKTSVSFSTTKAGEATATLKSPKDGKTIWGNAVSLVAQANDKTEKVLFQFLYENHSAWTTVETDAKKPYHVYWNVSDANVSTGSYRLRAVAYDAENLPDESPEEIQVTIDDANADIVEDGNPDVNPNKEHKISASVAAAEDEEVVVADGTTVEIPKNTVEANDTIEIVSVKPENTPKPKKKENKAKHLKSADVFKEINFTSGKSKFATEITVTLPTPDEDEDGVLDGTDMKIANLKPYFYDETKTEWVKIKQKGNYALSSTAGGGAGVAFSIDHFTLFGLFEEFTVLQVTTMGEVYCFPNPARAGQSPTFHVEAGAADKVSIRVYDVSGEMVHSADVLGPPSIIDDGQGPEQAFEYKWNTGSVGSGVYYFVAAAHGAGVGSSKRTGKCSVIK